MRTHKIALSGLMACLALSSIALTVSGCAGSRYQRSTGAYLDDKSIDARVKTALFRDPMVSGFDVHVNSYRGEVQLSGFVDTPEQKERAARVAQSADGVRMVTNNLEVKPASAMGAPGATVTGTSETVNQPPLSAPANDTPALDNSRNLAPSRSTPIQDQTPIVNPGTTATETELPPKDLEIKISNGRAVINGRAYNEAQSQTIERHVREMPGVTSIENRLDVKAPPPIR
jgi:hyperosmotically inducible periplasmic protein